MAVLRTQTMTMMGILLLAGHSSLAIADTQPNVVEALRGLADLLNKEKREQVTPPADGVTTTEKTPSERRPCDACPVRVAQPATDEELRAWEPEHTKLLGGYPDGYPEGKVKPREQWLADQRTYARRFARTASRQIQVDSPSGTALCKGTTEAKAAEWIQEMLSNNIFLTRKHTAPGHYRLNPDVSSKSMAIFIPIAFEITKEKWLEKKKTALFCLLTDEDVLVGAVDAYADIAYHNYQMLWQLAKNASQQSSSTGATAGRRPPAQNHPMQEAFDRLGRNQCDKWANSQGGEWLNTTIDMSANLADRGSPRKFWGTVTAGNASEFVVHFSGGGNAAVLTDFVSGSSMLDASNLIVKTNSKTVMKTRNLRINGDIIGYGKQVGTRNIRLANGAASTAAVIEASCLE